MHLGYVLTLATLLASPPPSPDPAAVLVRARAAQGGAAWDELRSLRLTGTIVAGGLAGPATLTADVRTGRFRDAWQLGPMKWTSGFDGKDTWSQDASGQSRVDDADTPRRTAVTESYRRAQAWWYPSRHRAEIRALEPRTEGDRRFDVLSITPEGGRAFELWVDAATGLFERFVDRVAVDTLVTHLSDWRDVGGVRVPFSVRVVRVGDEGKHDNVISFTRAERDVHVDDATFRRPGPPPRDFGFAGGRTSTTVPFTVVGGHIYVDVKLNGRGPYRLILDTGGVNIVTPAVAREIGLRAQGQVGVSGAGEKVEDVGFAEVDRLELGDAWIGRDSFVVYALDAMSHVEGVPEQGIVGYAVFRRFVTRVDYERGLLTLTDPATFRPPAGAVPIPFSFNEHIPQVKGAIDGVPGTFDIDTGARTSLTLTTPFATRHGLYEKMRAGPERILGWGVGGAARGRMARGRALTLGVVEVAAPVVGLSTTTRGLADPDVAGNVGYGVLSRFTVTFDYGRQQLFFERNASHGKPDSADRSGLWVNAADGGWEVVDVVPGSPAAEAGLAVGDRITSVAGRTPAQLSLADLRTMLRETPAGTRLELRVRHGPDAQERTLHVVLRDLV